MAAERTRIADGLHDGALQRLMAARQNWAEAQEGSAEAMAALGWELEALAAEDDGPRHSGFPSVSSPYGPGCG